MATLLKPAFLVVALVSCSIGAQPDAPLDAACPHSAAGTPYTPGMVSCGGMSCPAGSCVMCDATTGMTAPVCGATPSDTCRFTIACDGPEDCAPGERCYAFESFFCAASPPYEGARAICHTDDDCECPEHCDVFECRL